MVFFLQKFRQNFCQCEAKQKLEIKSDAKRKLGRQIAKWLLPSKTKTVLHLVIPPSPFLLSPFPFPPFTMYSML